jgi:hypothetical protein
MAPAADPEAPPQDLDSSLVEFALSPEGQSEKASVHGTLFVSVPGPPEASHPLARILAHDFAEHVNLFYPGFRILGGLLVAERLPETAAEADAIAAGPFWATASLEEVPHQLPPDPELLQLFPYARDLLVPITQFNAATRTSNPIDGFLSAIKALEYLYHRSGTFARSLQSSLELRTAVSQCLEMGEDDAPHRPPTEAEIDRLLADLADTRNKCAHLRDNGNYGYGQRHPEIFSVVRPMLELLLDVTKHLLRTRNG